MFDPLLKWSLAKSALLMTMPPILLVMTEPPKEKLRLLKLLDSAEEAKFL